MKHLHMQKFPAQTSCPFTTYSFNMVIFRLAINKSNLLHLDPRKKHNMQCKQSISGVIDISYLILRIKKQRYLAIF